MYRGLAHLQAAEFLYETRLFPELEYTFKHALTHEVAYSGLLQERRRALHAQIVDAIERLSPDHVADQVERLGHHAVCGERWDKAVAYCRQAGEKALARSAHREAVAYFEQALSALTHLPEQCVSREQAIDLRLALRSALQPLGALERVLTLLREAESLATGLDDPSRRGQVARALSNHFYLRGAPDQAITAGQHALALGTASGDVVLQALANLGLGYAYHAQGAYRLALACLGQSVAALAGTRRHERFGQVILPAVNARVWCAWCQAELGMFTEGAALGEEGLQIAEAIGHPGSLMAASWGLGLLSLHQGDLGRALPRLERAMSLCQDADLPSWFSRIAAALGAAYYLGERIADAMPLLMQAMAQATAAESVYQAQCRLSLGAAQLLADRLADAQALAERALAHAREHQERGHQAYALRLLGNIAAHQNPQEIEPAAHHYRQALALADALGMRPLVAHCHRDLGTLCAQLGKSEQARITLSMAIALYRDMGMTCWLPHAEATLAQIEAHPC
jgi:tetratricopeptide (TPR) repeat protein